MFFGYIDKWFLEMFGFRSFFLKELVRNLLVVLFDVIYLVEGFFFFWNEDTVCSGTDVLLNV